MIFYEEDKSKYNIYPGRVLKEEQVDAIDFILHKFNCILNLKPGLGKTTADLISAYKILSKTNDTVCFILCPKAANTAFDKEFKGMGLKYSILTTEEKRVEKSARFFLFNFSNIDMMIDTLYKLRSKGFRVFCVVDELHQAVSEDSNLAVKLRNCRNQFTCVIGSTGTPLLNDIMGLYRAVNFVRPGYLGTEQDFKSRYLIIAKKTIRVGGGKQRKIEDIKGYKNLDTLRKVLEDVIITRGVEYPLKYFFRQCNLTEEEKNWYEIAAKGIMNNDSDSEKVMSARLWDLQKVADGSAYDMRGKVYSKHTLLIETLREIVQRGEGTLIYSDMEDSYTTLKELIENYRGYIGYNNLYLITGKVPYKKRVEVERTLKEKDIVIVTKAGCTAINLQAVNNAVFYDTPFAIENIIQFIGRIARIDSKYKQMNVYFLEVKDTIDTYKRLLMQSNMSVVQEIFGRDTTLPYYGDIQKDIMMKYRTFFKRKMLWCKVD